MKTEAEIILAQAIADAPAKTTIFTNDPAVSIEISRITLDSILESLYGKIVRKGALYAKGGAGRIMAAIGEVKHTAESAACIMRRIPGEVFDMALTPIAIAIDSNVVHGESELLACIERTINSESENALPYGSILTIEFEIRKDGKDESPYMAIRSKDITKSLKAILMEKESAIMNAKE